MKKAFALLSLLILASLVLAACSPAPTPEPTPPPVEPTDVPPTDVPPTDVPAWTPPEGALAALPVDAAPTLDGVADEGFWAETAGIVIPVAGGNDNFSTEATLKAVYTEDSVYFLITYADPTESWFRSPWQLNEDGTWTKVTDPNDKGGDNNTVYEDKFAMIWPINNSIANFESVGCFVACHAGENPDAKPYGNKYTATEGELGDIWHWKSIRNLNQIDDQYLDSTRYSADTPEAGRKSDAKESGGYANNETEDKTAPAFTSPAVDLVTGAPGYILDLEKIALDQAAVDAMAAGSYVPGIVKSEFVGDRGDIAAGWKWADGAWTIEFGRKLETGSETDVQFSDLAAPYYFGLAIFENAQVRHAFETGASFLVFQPR